MIRISNVRPMLLASAVFFSTTLYSGEASAAAQVEPNSAAAESSAGAAFEEIIVTARRRDETLQDVPVAISAFTSSDIRSANIVDIRNLSAVAPGLTIIDAGGNGAGGRAFGQIYIRPLPALLPLPRTQTGSLFVDGIFVLGSASSIDTSDIERIEVIKGPQSALFGRNTFGGAINFITRRPGNDFGGSFDASATTRHSYRVSGSVEGPLVTDVLAARVTGTLYKKGAQYTANDGGALGEESSKSVSLTVSATPSPGLTMRVRGNYIRDEDGPSQETFLRGNVYGSFCSDKTFKAATNTGEPVTYTGFRVRHFCGTLPSAGDLGPGVVSQNTSITPPFLATIGIPNKLLDILNGATPELNNDSNYLGDLLRNVPHMSKMGLKRDIIRVSADAQYEFGGGIMLSALFGYNSTKQNSVFDKDHTDSQNQWSVMPATFEDWSAEARLSSSPESRFRWSLGANYSELDFLQQELTYIIRRNPTQPYSTVASINVANGEKANVLGLFGSAEFDILSNLTVTAEARYQIDNSDPVPYLVLQGLPAAPKYKFKTWLPRAIVRFEPSDTVTLYASYSKGVLPGQGNPAFLTATEYQRGKIRELYPTVSDVTDVQKLDSYEVGIKQKLFDGGLSYSLSAYYMDWSNIFASGIVTTPTSATDSTPKIFQGIFLPGSAKLWGVELEGSFNLTSELSGRFSASWQDNRYREVFGTSLSFTPGYVRFDGNEIPRIPDITGSLSLTYRTSLNNDWDWYVRGDARYVGKAWESEGNVAKMNDYVRVNARIGFDNSNDLTAELFVNNLLNDKNWDYGFRSTSLAEPGYIFGPAPFQSGVLVRAPDRREVGLRVGVKF